LRPADEVHLASWRGELVAQQEFRVDLAQEVYLYKGVHRYHVIVLADYGARRRRCLD